MSNPVKYLAFEWHAPAVPFQSSPRVRTPHRTFDKLYTTDDARIRKSLVLFHTGWLTVTDLESFLRSSFQHHSRLRSARSALDMDAFSHSRTLLDVESIEFYQKYNYLTRYHGWVLATGFGLLMPLAIVVSRCFKERRGIWCAILPAQLPTSCSSAFAPVCLLWPVRRLFSLPSFILHSSSSSHLQKSKSSSCCFLRNVPQRCLSSLVRADATCIT